MVPLVFRFVFKTLICFLNFHQFLFLNLLLCSGLLLFVLHFLKFHHSYFSLVLHLFPVFFINTFIFAIDLSSHDSGTTFQLFVLQILLILIWVKWITCSRSNLIEKAPIIYLPFHVNFILSLHLCNLLILDSLKFSCHFVLGIEFFLGSFFKFLLNHIVPLLFRHV